MRRYSAGIYRGTIRKDGLKYDAILGNLELNRDAATHGPAELREQLAGFPGGSS